MQKEEVWIDAQLQKNIEMYNIYWNSNTNCYLVIKNKLHDALNVLLKLRKIRNLRALVSSTVKQT